MTTRARSIIAVIALMMTPLTAFAQYGPWSMHNPTTTVYATGVPGGGDKPPANAVTFKVYQVEQNPWATGTFVNPPGMTLYGWNKPLSWWPARNKNTVATAKAQTANHPDIVRSVTVQ